MIDGTSTFQSERGQVVKPILSPERIHIDNGVYDTLEIPSTPKATNRTS